MTDQIIEYLVWVVGIVSALYFTAHFIAYLIG
jgi:hypothetical protein